MPILPAEPNHFPDDLFQGPASSLSETDRWWVLHTRPRAEKSLARAIYQARRSFYLPLYVHQWRSNGRYFKSQLPLFPGYVFLHADEGAAMDLRSTGWVANVLQVSEQNQLHEDLFNVFRLIATGAPLQPEQKLRPGARVVVNSGPFQGLEGTVMRKGSKLRLVVQVHLLQQGVSVDMETWMVAPTTDRRQGNGLYAVETKAQAHQ